MGGDYTLARLLFSLPGAIVKSLFPNCFVLGYLLVYFGETKKGVGTPYFVCYYFFIFFSFFQFLWGWGPGWLSFFLF